MAPIRAAAQISSHTSSSGHSGLFMDEADQEADLEDGQLGDADGESASHSDAPVIFHASVRLQQVGAPPARFIRGHERVADGSAGDSAVHGARAPPRV